MGFSLNNANGVELSGNQVEGRQAIAVRGGRNLRFYHNTLLGSKVGIKITGEPQGITLTNNLITHSGKTGVFAPASGVTIGINGFSEREARLRSLQGRLHNWTTGRNWRSTLHQSGIGRLPITTRLPHD